MKRKIALTGFKRTGKDYVADNIFKSYKIHRIADNIKLQCIKTNARRGNDFLLEDDKKYTELYTSGKILENPEILHLRGISSLQLSNSDLLLKINVYKTIDGLVSRSKVYEFIELQDLLGYDYWIKETVNTVSGLENDKIIITDCRMLIEIIDLLLNDFFVLNLYNSRIVDINKNMPNCLFHSTELQLGSLGDKGIGYNLDITSRDFDYLQSIITEIVDLFYKNFTQYSLQFKEELQLLRKQVLEKVPQLEKQIDLAYTTKNIKEYMILKQGIQEYQDKLRDLVQREYQNYIIF